MSRYLYIKVVQTKGDAGSLLSFSTDNWTESELPRNTCGCSAVTAGSINNSFPFDTDKKKKGGFGRGWTAALPLSLSKTNSHGKGNLCKGMKQRSKTDDAGEWGPDDSEIDLCFRDELYVEL